MYISILNIDLFSKLEHNYITIDQLIEFIETHRFPFPLIESPKKEILQIAEHPEIYFDKSTNKFLNNGIYFEKSLIEQYLEPSYHGKVINNANFLKTYYLEAERVSIYGVADRFANNTFYKDIFYNSLPSRYNFPHLLNSYEWRLYLILLDSPFDKFASFCYNIYKLKYNESYTHTFKRYQFYFYPNLLSDALNMIRRFLIFIYKYNLTKYFKEFPNYDSNKIISEYN